MDEDWGEYDWDSPEDWPWEEIESIHVFRDDAGWDISIEIDGVLIDILEGVDDETAQDLIWDDIYNLAAEYGVDIDKEVDYAKD